MSSRMFATLDPTVRAMRLPSNRRILVSDTVGFIRALPKGLITAFRATLEEVQEAALLLQVSDISNLHHDELDREVEKILENWECWSGRGLRVFNKVDQLTPEQREEFAAAWRIAAHAEKNHRCLCRRSRAKGWTNCCGGWRRRCRSIPIVKLSLHMPLSEGRTLALIHALGRVMHSQRQ